MSFILLMPLWLQAIFWGTFTGGALIIGALIGYFSNLSQRVVGGIMAFGSGALISALSFELVGKAYEKGGLASTAAGFVAGAALYSCANVWVSRYGAKHRKRSNLNNTLEIEELNKNGVGIALGAAIDGIPESIVIGLGIIAGGCVSLVTVAAVFVSNVPEALSSTVGMKNSGRKLGYILSIWAGITGLSAISAWVGYYFFQGVPEVTVSFIMAITAGAILAMIADTMIPEAFEETHNFAGFITVIGFLSAFMLEKF